MPSVPNPPPGPMGEPQYAPPPAQQPQPQPQSAPQPQPQPAPTPMETNESGTKSHHILSKIDWISIKMHYLFSKQRKNQKPLMVTVKLIHRPNDD